MTTDVVSEGLSGTAPQRLRSLHLQGQAGRLEAYLNEGRSNAPAVALVAHPHPLGGGTLHNKVVYHAMKAINDPAFGLGWPVLRFNFRGVGLSDGAYDGAAEQEDVLTALDWLSHEYGLPILAAGFSFGSVMTLAACGNEAVSSHSGVALVRAMLLMGLPIDAMGRRYSYPSLATCTLPKLFLSGDQDQFAPVEQLQSIVSAAAQPKTLKILGGADHFMTGHLKAMQLDIATWLRDVNVFDTPIDSL